MRAMDEDEELVCYNIREGEKTGGPHVWSLRLAPVFDDNTINIPRLGAL
jgi:hypothetical protein